MAERSSKYFRTLVCEGQGDTVVEQVFPIPYGEPSKRVGKKAEDITTLLDRIGVIKVCDQTESSAHSSKPEKYNPSGRRLEFKQQPDPDNANEVFTLPGWELQDEGPELVRQIEAQLGRSGLTIVLERGILQRPADQVQLKFNL